MTFPPEMLGITGRKWELSLPCLYSLTRPVVLPYENLVFFRHGSSISCLKYSVCVSYSDVNTETSLLVSFGPSVALDLTLNSHNDKR